jgi:hypothetical protein
LSLEFFYLNYLKIVAVKIESSTLPKDTTSDTSALLRLDTMFHCLYPGDNGVESPNLANKYLFSNAGVKSMETFMKPIGVAYRWCQMLCGLYYGSRPETRPDRVDESGDKCEVEMTEEAASGDEQDEEVEEVDLFKLKDLNESKLICQILNRVKSRFKARYTLQRTINSTSKLLKFYEIVESFLANFK